VAGAGAAGEEHLADPAPHAAVWHDEPLGLGGGGLGVKGMGLRVGVVFGTGGKTKELRGTADRLKRARRQSRPKSSLNQRASTNPQTATAAAGRSHLNRFITKALMMT